MCRRLGYPFACGMEEAGAGRTEDTSLRNISSVIYRYQCNAHLFNITAGGCLLFETPLFDPSLGPPCAHEQDTWLMCGFAGMPDFELRLVEEGLIGATRGLVQGRCGGRQEWGAICSNTFDLSTAGQVACRDLGQPPAISVGRVDRGAVDAEFLPDYTLFVDIGCVGDEASLSECEHHSLRYCESFASLECFTGNRDIRDIDIELVNGSAPNEGRVLVRWSPDFEWTAVCFSSNYTDALAFDMCRRLGYPFACGKEAAGAGRTDTPSLANIASVAYLTTCRSDPNDIFAGGCSLSAATDPVDVHPCPHEQDLWLSCGYAEMPDFELRLVEGAPGSSNKVVQGRCGGIPEWGAVCGHLYYERRAGPVVCRDLGLSNYSISTGALALGEVDAQLVPDYTLFVDIGCVGNESSLSECEHFSLRQCNSYATVQCFTEIREYEETAYLCGAKQLCGQQCNQQIHPLPNDVNVFHYCQCDDACVLFDDCCYDYAGVCDRRAPSLERGGFTADRFGCVWVPGSQFTFTGFVMIDRCSDDWRDEGIRALCEKPINATDVIGSLPVFDDQGVDFSNIFCALCNHRSLGKLSRWDVFSSYNKISSTTNTYYTSLNQTLPTKGWIITPPKNHTEIRKCPAHLIDTCLVDFRGTEMERACRAYYAPVRTDRENIRYRNPHCAMCNGKELVPDDSCMDVICKMTCEPDPWGPCGIVCGPYNEFFTIEVLFDFTSSSSINGMSCLEGQIYDPFLERCRVLTCAAGYRINGDECVAYTPVNPPINGSQETSAIECLAKRLGKDTAGGQALMAGQTIILNDPDAGTLSALILLTSVREALAIDAAFDVYVANASIDNPTTLSELLCNISTLSIYVPFALSAFSSCNLVNGNETFVGYVGNLLMVVKFQDIRDEGEYTQERTSPLCLKVADLNCSSLLTLKGSEYTILADEILQVTASGILAAEYVRFPDGSVVMCSFAGPLPEGLEPKIRRAISFAGSCLSLLALAATFVTYCVFPELRNTAGKSTMNLVVALFVAILLFLLTGYLRQSRAACVSGAAAAHFAWLAAFCWMTVLSVSVARTLASKVSIPHRGRGIDRALVSYMCLAWGIPLIIVTICLALQFCNCTSLPTIYAESNICWITDATVRVVVFLVPVAMSLVLNITTYVFTVINFRRNRQVSKAARHQTTTDAVREELSVYLKICTLVGVTWVFGFVSQSVTGIVVFSYIYILLNYLQGVFIFIAFCLNKRVRGLWRQKLRKMPAHTGKTNPNSLHPKHQTNITSSGTSGISHSKKTTESTHL
ncbi:uncharacterized protein LOC119724594 [Patiria miniata]|uniref:Uncharacterized protein n=1 Tax=Patiria miniata TaxID=46514 RepID=A0A913ZJW7_PATMI|nr:uncharacterized protein LOC119724594 [Patiria miniata]